MFQRTASIFRVEEHAKKEASRSKLQVQQVQFLLFQDRTAIRWKNGKENLEFRMHGNYICFKCICPFYILFGNYVLNN
jgi:hypothetical protein